MTEETQHVHMHAEDEMSTFHPHPQQVWASLVARRVKDLHAVWEPWVRSLSWKDPLEEGVQPTPVYLPGESPGQEPGRLQSMGLQRVRRNWATEHSTAKQQQPSALLDFSNETVEEGIKEEMSNASLILKIKVQAFFKLFLFYIGS